MFYIIFLLFLLLGYGLYEYQQIEVVSLNNNDFRLEKKLTHDQRIVFISDFQLDFSDHFFNHKQAKKIVEMVNNLKPDITLFGGDFVHRHTKKDNPIFTYLKEIKGTKIGVLGNHDYYNLDGVKAGCAFADIKLLVNETLEFGDFIIIGLDDLRESIPILPNYSNPENKIELLLMHEPDYFERIAYKKQFDMTLSGHLHGGQVTFFGRYAPILNSNYKQKYLKGFVEVNNQQIYVNRGLGGYAFIFPVRLGARPEITCIELKKES